MGRIGNKLQCMASGREPTLAFYFALAYFVWSIVPHFHLILHTHAGGAHAHAALSGAQVRLANQVLDDLGPAGLPDADPAEFGGEANAPAAAPGEPALAAGAAGSPHAHFWDDANLAGAASLTFFAALAAAILLFRLVRYLAPALAPMGPALARGPPVFFA